MTERINLVPAFKLTWEYFMEQPVKILLYLLLFALPSLYAQFIQALIITIPPILHYGLFFMFAGTLLYSSALVIKNQNKRKCILTLFQYGLAIHLYLLGKSMLHIEAPGPWYFMLSDRIILNIIPSSIFLYFGSQAAFSCIQDEKLSFAPINWSLFPFLKIFLLMLLHIVISTLPNDIIMLLLPQNHKTTLIAMSILTLPYWIITNYFFIRFFCAPLLITDRDFALKGALSNSWKMTKGQVRTLFNALIIYLLTFIAIGISTFIFTQISGIPLQNLSYMLYFQVAFQLLINPVALLFAVLFYRLLSSRYFDDMEKLETIEYGGESNE